MNTKSSEDEALSKVLDEWRQEALLPPGFRENVWLRIERSKTAEAPVPSLKTTIADWMSSRALAVSYVLALLTVGLVAGLAQGRNENTRIKDELGQRYLRVLDPYHAPRT